MLCYFVMDIKVKILKCSYPLYWYADKIGKRFDCIETDSKFEVIFNHPCVTFCIDKEDCKII